MEPIRPIIPVEEQFKIMADSAPVLIWIAGTDKLCYFFNAGWLKFTGRTLEQEYGNGWAEGVHPDDLQRILQIYITSFDARQEFKMEYRLRRYDGVYQWLLDNGVPRYTADGSFAGYIGSCMVIDELLESERVKKDFISKEAFQQEQVAKEQLAASNEELSAYNEEMQTKNEELAVVNEELNQTQRALEKSENQLRFTLNAIPNQVWTATSEGELNYVNQVVCEDFGYDADEIVGQGWQEFIHPDDLADCLKNWSRALESGNEYLVNFRLRFSDGAYRWHLARAVPFREDGQVKLWLGTNTNIDLQKKNEQKKDEFLSIASHELRTPLTSIKLYNQLINRAKDESQVKTFSGKTTDHILRLERLIADLLDVTKINAGKMNYSADSFDFGQMVRDSVEVISHSTHHEIVIENNISILYTGDQFRLEQVMNNFLSNAVKYSPNGEKIIVRVVLEHESIIVSVQDFGIGIDRESIDRLFDRYYRADNAAMRFDGLGLGLFISSEILKRHNGSFWIESEKDQGSIFFFRLPLERKKAYAAPVVTLTSYLHETLTITYLEDAGRLEVDWTGFQDLASVKAGCLAMLDMVVKTNCDRIVNDNTRVLGNWSEATDWVGNEWFPMMERAGVKYFAHIFSPSTFSQLAAQKSIDIMAGIITTQYFTDIKLAREWIDSCPA